MAALYESLPERLTPGPSWIVPAAIAVLIVPTIAARQKQSQRTYFALGILLNLVINLAVVWSLGILIADLLGKREAPAELLRSAVALWISNVLLFASWYWRVPQPKQERSLLRMPFLRRCRRDIRRVATVFLVRFLVTPQ